METANILRCLELLAVGIAIAIILLRLSPSTLEKLGEYITPSWISILHIPIAWIGYTLYVIGGIWLDIGFEIVVFAALLDKVDGNLATVLDIKHKGIVRILPKNFWEALHYRGKSEWGEIIDPAADKVAIMPIFLYIAYNLYVQAFQYGLQNNEDWLLLITAIIITAILFVDLLGTIVRMDAFRWLIKSAGASGFGKVKALSQWIWLILNVPFEQSWIISFIYEYSIFLNVFLFIVLLLGLMSLVSKMVEQEWIDRFTQMFKYKVE